MCTSFPSTMLSAQCSWPFKQKKQSMGGELLGPSHMTSDGRRGAWPTHMTSVTQTSDRRRGAWHPHKTQSRGRSESKYGSIAKKVDCCKKKQKGDGQKTNESRSTRKKKSPRSEKKKREREPITKKKKLMRGQLYRSGRVVFFCFKSRVLFLRVSRAQQKRTFFFFPIPMP